MRNKALMFLAAQQICYLSGIIICFLIRPAGLGANAGISYYGTYANTVPFYLLALLGSSIFSLLTGLVINVPSLKPLRIGLISFSLLILLISHTPYSVSPFFDLLHTLASMVLFAWQLTLSYWLFTLNWTFWSSLAGLVESVAGAASLVYIFISRGLLVQSQLVFQIAFAALLLISFIKLLPAKTTYKTARGG